jgi:hypothetical protein
MSGPKLGPSPTYLGFTRDRTPKLRKSAIADLRWLASLAPQGDGLRDISRLSAGPRWISMTRRLKLVAAGLCLRQRASLAGARRGPRADEGAWVGCADRQAGQHSRCALGRKEKPRAEAGRDLKWLREPLASPEAAPYSTAHVSGAMTRLSQAPVFVLTAPYASAPRIAMAVGTAAAERGYRFNR